MTAGGGDARHLRDQIARRLGLRLRAPEPDEFGEWRRQVARTFGTAADNDAVARTQHAVDASRALGAWDGGHPVATAIALGTSLTVPGGTRLPAAGVSMVTVAPTHRRRGLLSSMMATLLEDARDRGEAVAMLYASAGGIYRRFGFGIAAHSIELTVPPAARPAGRPAAGAPLRLLGPDAARVALPAIDEAVAARTVGAVGVPPLIWANLGHADPGGQPPLQTAVLGTPGAERGYVTYRVAVDWRERAPAAADGTLTVEHLAGVDAQAVLTLWDFVLQVDLVARWEARMRPVDDPLLLAAADPLAIGAAADEPLWLRLLDVPTALRGRRWTGSGALILAVVDPHGGEDRWRLAVDDGVATVEPTAAGADLRLPLADLSAVYLGGSRTRDLARVGRIDELSHGAAARFDDLLRTWPAPWCGWHF